MNRKHLPLVALSTIFIVFFFLSWSQQPAGPDTRAGEKAGKNEFVLSSPLDLGPTPPSDDETDREDDDEFSWSPLAPLLQLVRKRAKDGEIFLAYTNMAYLPLAHNLALSMHRLDIHNYVILTDTDHAVQKLASFNIVAFNVASVDLPETVALREHVADAEVETADAGTRYQHWRLRSFVLLQVLKGGFGVFQTDVDMVFRRNPYEVLDIDQFDWEAQGQDWPDFCQQIWRVDCMNGGVSRYAAKPAVILHFETMFNLMMLTGVDPQTLDNRILQLGGVSWQRDHRCGGGISDVQCPAAFTRLLRVRQLPHTYFMHFPQELAHANAAGVDWVLLHTHVAGPGTKTQANSWFMKLNHLWYVPDGTYEEIDMYKPV